MAALSEAKSLEASANVTAHQTSDFTIPQLARSIRSCETSIEEMEKSLFALPAGSLAEDARGNADAGVSESTKGVVDKVKDVFSLFTSQMDSAVALCSAVQRMKNDFICRFYVSIFMAVDLDGFSALTEARTLIKQLSSIADRGDTLTTLLGESTKAHVDMANQEKAVFQLGIPLTAAITMTFFRATISKLKLEFL